MKQYRQQAGATLRSSRCQFHKLSEMEHLINDQLHQLSDRHASAIRKFGELENSAGEKLEQPQRHAAALDKLISLEKKVNGQLRRRIIRVVELRSIVSNSGHPRQNGFQPHSLPAWITADNPRFYLMVSIRQLLTIRLAQSGLLDHC